MMQNKRKFGFTLLILFTNSVLACGGAVKRNCPTITETTAYIDHKETVTGKMNIGKIYKNYMERLEGLEATGHFKKLEIISQTADIVPSYDNSTITTLTLRATIKFDLNYTAVSDLHEKFKKSVINVSTYDIEKCSE